MSVTRLLVLPHIKVHNANALSSPFTIGFPAMTAFLGAVHALQRKLNHAQLPVIFSGVGVISHQANLQTHKGDNDFVHSIIGAGNPLDKTGARSAFIEEARIHLDVSLIIEIEDLALELREALLEHCQRLLQGNMKLAGGDIFSMNEPQFHIVDDQTPESYARLQRQLMPGYALIERRDLMQQSMAETDALDALIDRLAVHYQCTFDEEKEETVWTRSRKQSGWIVPIATGFHAISELGQAKNQRDENTPHRFVESVVTLGEFKMPHRVKHLEQFLWRYHVNHDDNLYLCQQSTYLSTNGSDLVEESPDDEF